MRHTGDKTVLIVEAERPAEELRRRLSDLGYRVPAAAAARDALRLASEIRPDLVVVDAAIEGAPGGIQLAEQLRGRLDAPILFLAADADAAELWTAIEIALHRVEVERRLRDRERWFATILRAVGDAVIATNRAGEVTTMNVAAELLAGVREADAAGRALAEVGALVDERTRAPLPDPIALAIAGGRPVPLPEGAVLVGRAGERAVDGLCAPLVDDRGIPLGAVLALRDAGEQRRLRQQIAVADRLTALGALASGIAHEINNPLTAVVANASYLANELATARREARTPAARPEDAFARIAARVEPLPHVVAELREGADRIRHIVAELRTSSREERASEVAPGPSDLREVVAWAVRTTAAEVQPRARLVMELGPTPPVAAGEVRLGQVLVHLLIHAARSIEEGHPARNEIHVSTEADSAGQAVVSIRDTGRGMAPDALQRLLDPSIPARSVGEGAGLGVAISHGIVRSLGGELTAESEVGAGSTFRVVLPSAEPEMAAPADAPAELRGRILVIDDEPLLVEVVRRVLDGEHDVVTLVDAREAMSILRAPPGFDLVLCDVLMPGLHGVELYERVRELDPAIAERFVFLTGGLSTPGAMKFLDSIPNLRFGKPFSPEQLQAFVRAFLRATGPAPRRS